MFLGKVSIYSIRPTDVAGKRSKTKISFNAQWNIVHFHVPTIVTRPLTNTGEPWKGCVCPNAFILFPVIPLSLTNITFPYILYFLLLPVEVKFCK